MKRRPPVIDGVLLVDKPAGWTSFDVVAKLRRIVGERRIGHTGTLDPAATGLLVVCIGRATRFVEYMTLHDKRYEGRITLGTSTTTDDAEGDVIETGVPPPLTAELLERVRSQFSGALSQRPPAYSAISVDGKRAYARARAGETVELAHREVVVHSLELRPTEDGSTIDVSVHCGPGTYIRSIARDIGVALGCPAHLSALRRTTVGFFRVDEAFSLAQLEQLASAGTIRDALLSLDEGLMDWPAAILADGPAARLAVGQAVAVDGSGFVGEARLYTTGGEFGGVIRFEAGNVARALKMLPSPPFVMTSPESEQA